MYGGLLACRAHKHKRQAVSLPYIDTKTASGVTLLEANYISSDGSSLSGGSIPSLSTNNYEKRRPEDRPFFY